MTRPRIAVAGFEGLFTDHDRAAVAEIGDVIDWSPLGNLADDRALEVLAEADVLLGHWGTTPLTAHVLDAAPNLRLFAYAAGTVKALVTDAVFDRGIVVTSGAAANARPVAEYTLAMILLANKNAFTLAAITRDPELLQPGLQMATPGNRCKRVGIIGASLVGRATIELLAPFDLDVLVSDPFLTPGEAEALGVEKVELDDLLRRSHVVSLHAPILESTIGMIGVDELALMRDGATFVNTARGVLVDHDALTAELMSGRIGAVLDVTDPHEPIPPDWPPLSRPNVFVTPHIAGAQGTEVARLNALAIDEIRRFVQGEAPLHPVTRADLSRIA